MKVQRLLSLSVFFLAGCVMTKAEGDQLKMELDLLKNEIAALQRHNYDTTHKLTRIESGVDNQQRTKAEAEIRAERVIDEQLQSIRGQLEETQHQLSEMKAQLEQKSSPSPISATSESKVVANEDAPKKGKQELLHDLEKLVRQNKFDGAMLAIDEWLERFGKDRKLAGDVYYWQGECYFKQAKKAPSKSKKELFKKAIVSYQRVMSEYSSSSKVASSIYKMGLSFEEIGMQDDATAFYEEVLDKYAKSDVAKDAKNRLSQIRKSKKK